MKDREREKESAWQRDSETQRGKKNSTEKQKQQPNNKSVSIPKFRTSTRTGG